MYPIDNDNINEREDPEFNHSLFESLKNAGYVFPENEEDIDRLLANFKKAKCIAPSDFEDPLTVLKNGFLSVTTDFNSSRDKEIEANLAQAAREGGTIDDDVDSQMKKDRKAAEDERRNRED
jgi:hypothetical protein